MNLRKKGLLAKYKYNSKVNFLKSKNIMREYYFSLKPLFIIFVYNYINIKND